MPDDRPVVEPRRRSVRWKRAGLSVVILVGIGLAFLVRPVWHVACAWWSDDGVLAGPPPGHVDDASRLNQTAVAELVAVEPDPDRAAAQLRELLDRARREGLKVAVAGARHTMGGHTIYPGGIALDMTPFDRMSLDQSRNLLIVGSGARWDRIIPFLDAHGRSVAIMQSNNSFSVGGSISANCHGWQPNRPPIASSVESFRLMLANGRIVRCSREENAELFGAVLGGYGLFGIILDVELRVVPNERYRHEQHVVSTADYMRRYRELVESRADEVGLAYGRLCIEPGENFLREAILTVFRRDPAPDGSIPELTAPGMTELRRAIFRGSVGSEYGKGLRWDAEKNLAARLGDPHVSRNALLNESIEVFQNRSADSTDILHEYFVPPDAFEFFLVRVREIVPRHNADLLNVTVRDVRRDDDTLLRYADRDMVALVMLFNQDRTPEGESAMADLTRDLIEAALDAGGRYYLPYRLHATPDQFRRAYPMADRFFELKRKYDPEGLFQNEFYRRYGPGETEPAAEGGVSG